jgi:hypothetical protein
MVFGIDPISKTVLWEKNLFTMSSPVPGQGGGAWPPGYNQLIVDPRDGSLQVTYQDGWVQRLGGTGPLEGAVICLQTRDALVAVDPITGRTLWTRSDVNSRCHIFGDQQNIYVVETGSDGGASATRAIRAYDGVSVKVPDFAAAYQKRVRMIGRTILLSDTDAKNAVTLRLYDVLTGKDLFKETFAANSQVLRTEDSHFAGMVEPDGKVRVFDLRNQKEVLAGAKMDPKHLDKVQSLHLLADGKYFYVACNGPVDPNVAQWGGVQSNLMPGTGLRGLPVNGEVYCWEAGTAKEKWHNPVPNQMLVLDQFQDLPFVLFTSRYQKLNQNGNIRNVIQVVAVKSIEKRTGKMLYDNDNIPNGPNFHALTVDAKAGKIEFVGYQLKLIHELNSDGATNK